MLLPLVISGLILFVIIYFWISSFNPKDVSAEPIVRYENVPLRRLKKGDAVKVMTYNIQFMAGKNYVFFFDLPDWSGPDIRPSIKDMHASAEGIAKMIEVEDPDIILLQEVDVSSKRTGGEDQLELLLSHLPGMYSCSTSTFYWKVKFVPHPKIWGSIGIKQVILSKYEISASRRLNLPMLPVNPIVKRLTARRALLQATLPVDDGPDLVVMNTHLEAFVVGTNIMEQQVQYIDNSLHSLSEEGKYWLIGGDFNLMPQNQYKMLPATEQSYYNSDSEIVPLYKKYRIVPSQENITSSDYKKWFTYWGNNPSLKEPDRTLDYIIYSDKLELLNSTVRMRDTGTLSDHFPVITVFKIT